MRTLHAVSPLATLERGYAIVTDQDARVVTDASRLAPGAQIEARVARGAVHATVTRVVAATTDAAGGAKKPAQRSKK